MGFKSNIFTIIVTAIVSLTVAPTALQISKYVETTYFPVIKPIEITKVNRTPDGQIIVWGRTEKIRDCNFENISFFKKSRFGDVLVNSERMQERPLPSAPIGPTPFGPWKVDVTKEEFEATVEIKTLHDCHPMYLSETILYNKGQLR